MYKFFLLLCSLVGSIEAMEGTALEIVQSVKSARDEIRQKGLIFDIHKDLYKQLSPRVSLLVKERQWEKIKLLISLRYLPIHIVLADRKRLLHHAVEQQNIDAVSFLLINGANPNNQDKDGFFPEEYNIATNNKSITQAFTEYCWRKPDTYELPLLINYANWDNINA